MPIESHVEHAWDGKNCPQCGSPDLHIKRERILEDDVYMIVTEFEQICEDCGFEFDSLEIRGALECLWVEKEPNNP